MNIEGKKRFIEKTKKRKNNNTDDIMCTLHVVFFFSFL